MPKSEENRVDGVPGEDFVFRARGFNAEDKCLDYDDGNSPDMMQVFAGNMLSGAGRYKEGIVSVVITDKSGEEIRTIVKEE